MSVSDDGSKRESQVESSGIRRMVLGATANGGHSPTVLEIRVESERDA